MSLLIAYGGKCVCCGDDYEPFLTLDHVTPVRQTGGRGQRMYAQAKREGYPPDYQILCANCNMAKGTRAECPCPTQVGQSLESLLTEASGRGMPTGVRNPASKLTENQVEEIRARWSAGGCTKTALGAEYGVSRSTIANIVNYKVWAWLGGSE